MNPDTLALPAAGATIAQACGERVAAVVRADVRAQSAYVVADARGMLKLDAMENPYPLPGPVRERMVEALAGVAINRYPDGAAEAVKRAVRTAFDVPAEAAVMLGNGSDELIQIFCLALARPGAVVLAPEPTFVMYRIHALFAGMRYQGVPLGEGFALDRAAMLAAIARDAPALVYLSFPNNPTGNLFDAATMEAILDATPGLVVVDEAYSAFASRSMLSQVLERPNLVVLRTLSKLGMAGLRLGFAVGRPEWIGEINKVRQPYNVNALTQAAVCALLAAPAWIDDQAGAIRQERSRLERELAALPGVSVFPTETNFVLARMNDASSVFSRLKEAGILVKFLGGWHPSLAGMIRITVGTPAENAQVLAALRGQMP